MKKVYSLAICISISLGSFAQLNYLFSASSRPYIPVTNGIAPHLKSDNVRWEVEDEGFARVPIGFNFKYNGENYRYANIHVNGFITFKDSLDIFWEYPYYLNNLKRLPNYYKRAILAAFWDDLLMLDTLSMVYKTTGIAPFRVFTVEWKKVKWVYESPAPVLSIELKLYETTNIIEFQYKDEGNLPDPRFSYASIGITSDYSNRGFISLQSTSANPEISFVKSNDSLHIKPANNQVYRFIPAPLKIPAPLDPSLRYTNNKVSFRLETPGFNSYEYAISKSPIPPASGKKTFSDNITVSNLTPATTYYIYARSTFWGFLHSQWTCDSFKTAVNTIKLPYTPNTYDLDPYTFSPKEMRQQDLRDTNYWASPADAGFSAWNDVFEPGDHMFIYDQYIMYDADSWLFTPGFEFDCRKNYQLKFGYYAFDNIFNNTDLVAGLEVKYGKATGADAMTQGLLFRKKDIQYLRYIDDILEKRDTTIDFSPNSSGTYYIGFHDISLRGQAGLLITNISVSEKTNLPVLSFVLDGSIENRSNILNWENLENSNTSTTEIERSKNGIDFEKIGSIDAVGTNKYIGWKPMNFKLFPNTEVPNNGIIADKHSKLYDATAPLLLPNGMKRTDLQKLLGNPPRKIIEINDSKKSLRYRDNQAGIGAMWYRLKQVINGKMVYSNIIKLERTLQLDALYPNPVRDIVQLKIQSSKNAKNRISITDVSGKVVLTRDILLSAGINQIQLPIGNLSSNTYFINIIDMENGQRSTEKFVKQ